MYASQPLPKGLTPQQQHAEHRRRVVLDIFQYAILVLSVMLIVYISIDTFKGLNFLESAHYMGFQFIVCLVFIADFFVELYLTPRGHKRSYWKHRWLFLLLSIPFLNIVALTRVPLNDSAMEILRYIPLTRGILALTIVFDFLAVNRITGLFVSYITIMAMAIYFCGLIFYQREQPVNPGVADLWDAFWWASLQATTLSCSLFPVTTVGKVLSVLLSAMGIIMFPLFTIYMTDLIRRQRQKLINANVSKSKVKNNATPTSAPPKPDTSVGSST